MRWVDCATRCPPDTTVLAVDDLGRIELGRYNHAASSNKGCELPNNERRAVWLFDHAEGVRVITHFAELYLPKHQADGSCVDGLVGRAIDAAANISREVDELRRLLAAIGGQV